MATRVEQPAEMDAGTGAADRYAGEPAGPGHAGDRAVARRPGLAAASRPHRQGRAGLGRRRALVQARSGPSGGRRAGVRGRPVGDMAAEAVHALPAPSPRWQRRPGRGSAELAAHPAAVDTAGADGGRSGSTRAAAAPSRSRSRIRWRRSPRWPRRRRRSRRQSPSRRHCRSRPAGAGASPSSRCWRSCSWPERATPPTAIWASRRRRSRRHRPSRPSPRSR